MRRARQPARLDGGMPFIAATIALVLFAVLVLFQAALAAGAPWGAAAYGGQVAGVLPGRLRASSAIAVLVWVALGLCVGRAGGIPVWAPVPDGWLPVVVWVVVGLLVVASLLNAITRSRVERAIWLPVSLVLLAATVVVALF